MDAFAFPWAGELDSPLLKRYCRTKRFSLERTTQEVVAVYMCSDQATVALAENEGQRWTPGPSWHVRQATALAHIEIKVNEVNALRFWHAVNKYWVAAGYKAPLVRDPYDATYNEILAEVYADISHTVTRPDYQRYEAGCLRMHRRVA
jgi:hypothetical protein